MAKISQRVKDQHRAKFFMERKLCEHCRVKVPREQGDYFDLPSGRRVWMCKRHAEAGG